MSEDANSKKPDAEIDDEDRAAILARRNRFVRAALTGIVGASIVAACSDGGGDSQPRPCLEPVLTDGGSRDGSPQPCLSPPLEDGDIPSDADAADDASPDAGPDADADATPQPCLTPPFDSGAD